MMQGSCLDIENDLFSGEKRGDVLILSFKEKPLLHATDLNTKKALFDYLDQIERSASIRALLLKEPSLKLSSAEYAAFYRSMIQSDVHQRSLERLYNAVSQLILKVVNLEKMVVHVDSGRVNLLFMNLGLACDYRIVADNTVYQNPNFELGLVPKGGSAFLLTKMVGSVKAAKILLTREQIGAHEALELGIVDKVVSLAELDSAAHDVVGRYAQIPASYASSVKRLLNSDSQQLASFMEYESEVLRMGLLSSNVHADRTP